jgi:hypothetical protein
MSNGTPSSSTPPAQTDQDIEDQDAQATSPPNPAVYQPTDEVPDVIPPKPRKYPLSSAPLPPGVSPTNAPTKSSSTPQATS